MPPLCPFSHDQVNFQSYIVVVELSLLYVSNLSLHDKGFPSIFSCFVSMGTETGKRNCFCLLRRCENDKAMIISDNVYMGHYQKMEESRKTKS